MSLGSMSDGEILRFANPIMDNLMEASTVIDHERHIRDFNENEGDREQRLPSKGLREDQREKG
jgi:hypothetical protein